MLYELMSKTQGVEDRIGETVFDWDIGVPYRDAYMRLFWRPYLRNVAFTLYDTLISFASVQDICFAVDFNIEALVFTQGAGTRSTLLGREASGSRKAQDGAITLLADAAILRHWTRGEGRQVVHEFEVLPWLPLLAPAQVKELPRRWQRQHAMFLGCIPGFRLASWRKVKRPSYIPAMADEIGYTAVVVRR